jgi:hypothetical protein
MVILCKPFRLRSNISLKKQLALVMIELKIAEMALSNNHSLNHSKDILRKHFWLNHCVQHQCNIIMSLLWLSEWLLLNAISAIFSSIMTRASCFFNEMFVLIAYCKLKKHSIVFKGSSWSWSYENIELNNIRSNLHQVRWKSKYWMESQLI